MGKILFIFFLILFGSCASASVSDKTTTEKTEKIVKKCYNPQFENDTSRNYLSGKWARADFEDLISELTSKISKFDFKESKTIQFEKIENNTNDNIAVELITQELQGEFLKSNKLSVVSSKKSETDSHTADIIFTGKITKKIEENEISENKKQQKIIYTGTFDFTVAQKIIFQPQITITHICDIEN